MCCVFLESYNKEYLSCFFNQWEYIRNLTFSSKVENICLVFLVYLSENFLLYEKFFGKQTKGAYILNDQRLGKLSQCNFSVWCFQRNRHQCKNKNIFIYTFILKQISTWIIPHGHGNTINHSNQFAKTNTFDLGNLSSVNITTKLNLCNFHNLFCLSISQKSL